MSTVRKSMTRFRNCRASTALPSVLACMSFVSSCPISRPATVCWCSCQLTKMNRFFRQKSVRSRKLDEKYIKTQKRPIHIWSVRYWLYAVFVYHRPRRNAANVAWLIIAIELAPFPIVASIAIFVGALPIRLELFLGLIFFNNNKKISALFSQSVFAFYIFFSYLKKQKKQRRRRMIPCIVCGNNLQNILVTISVPYRALTPSESVIYYREAHCTSFERPVFKWLHKALRIHTCPDHVRFRVFWFSIICFLFF